MAKNGKRGEKRKRETSEEKKDSKKVATNQRGTSSKVNEGASTSRAGTDSNESEKLSSVRCEKSNEPVSTAKSGKDGANGSETTGTSVGTNRGDDSMVIKKSSTGDCEIFDESVSTSAGSAKDSSGGTASNGERQAEQTSGSSSSGTTNESSPSSSGGSGGGSGAVERFNERNAQVTPLRKCSELIVGRRYKIMNLSRTNTQYGPAVRAFIFDDRSPTGSSFCFLPVRFRAMSDEDISELNQQCASEKGLHLIYKGKVGRADMVELV